MSINFKTSAAETRETRLKSTISYTGTAKELNEKSKNLELTCKNRSFEQCSSCMQGCAFILGFVRDAAVVQHSPVGCFGSDAGFQIGGRAVSKARGLGEFKNYQICTNIQEKDTIYGGVDKLQRAIQRTYNEANPKVIFVTSSCASGIIGDDIESVCAEAQEKLQIPVVPIFCEGFKSKIWSSGFDAAFHGVMRDIVKKPKKRQEDLVNVFNFEGIDTFGPLLAKLNLRVNYYLPLASVEQLEQMSEAACSTQMCETLSSYVARGLEEQYGVVQIHTPAPFGTKWTDEWLREIAKVTNRENIVEKVIIDLRKEYLPKIEFYREKFKGKRLYVFAGDSYTHNMSVLAYELGFEIIGVTGLHHDQRSDNESINTLDAMVDNIGDIANFTICNKQPYRHIKILRELKPDLLITRHGGITSIGSKLGIPSIFEGDANASIGYSGLVGLAKRLDEALQTVKLVKNIAKHTEYPYTDWWLSEDTDPMYFEGGGK